MIALLYICFLSTTSIIFRVAVLLFSAPYMVIDSREKRFVMNMQLRQCFARAKLFRLKKS